MRHFQIILNQRSDWQHYTCWLGLKLTTRRNQWGLAIVGRPWSWTSWGWWFCGWVNDVQWQIRFLWVLFARRPIVELPSSQDVEV